MSDIRYLTVPVFSTLANAGFALRREVFVIEQNVPETEEIDEYDLTATHVVALSGGNVVGVLRLVFTPDFVKIGRVAVARNRRGQGIARDMMLFAMDHARGRGARHFHLGAQLDALAFYERLGFEAYGEVFLDAGIEHRAMRTP